MEISNASNQVIDTNQPRNLKGVQLRGVKQNVTIRTKKIIHGEERIMIVKEEDYDKALHGEKVDKLPIKKKVAKKAAEK